jgi:hypothetical protein
MVYLPQMLARSNLPKGEREKRHAATHDVPGPQSNLRARFLLVMFND